MSEVHVIPDDRTTWRVYDAGAREAVSEHTNATEAELAAQEHGADRVVVHDRYHRTHDAPTSLVGLRARARAMRTGARLLDTGREQARRLPRSRYPRPR